MHIQIPIPQIPKYPHTKFLYECLNIKKNANLGATALSLCNLTSFKMAESQWPTPTKRLRYGRQMLETEDMIVLFFF